MSDPGSSATTVVEPVEPDVTTTTDEEVVEEDVLVEDVSIDGMCGVY